jgi:hypothetical protein
MPTPTAIAAEVLVRPIRPTEGMPEAHEHLCTFTPTAAHRATQTHTVTHTQ